MSKVTPIKKAPAPLDGLSQWEADLWTAIVREWPAGYFKTCDLPLLAEYCRASSQAEDLAAHASKTHTIADLGEVLALRDREAKRMAAIARTLRLAPQSRYDRHAVATKARMSGSRPWETDDDPEDPHARFFGPKPVRD